MSITELFYVVKMTNITFKFIFTLLSFTAVVCRFCWWFLSTFQDPALFTSRRKIVFKVNSLWKWREEKIVMKTKQKLLCSMQYDHGWRLQPCTTCVWSVDTNVMAMTLTDPISFKKYLYFWQVLCCRQSYFCQQNGRLNPQQRLWIAMFPSPAPW